MSKYDVAPKDIIEGIKKKAKEGYFIERIKDKKHLAEYYEVILKDKKEANEIYEQIRKDLRKPQKKISNLNQKQMILLLRNLQNKETGSFIEYPTTFWIEIAKAKHILRLLKKNNLEPKYKLKFLDKINTGKKLKKYFKFLLHDFTKNNEDELNMVITSLPIIKDLGFHNFSKDWDKNYFQCIEYWQDNKTGYWGPWVKKGNKIIKKPELSTTFHILRLYYDKNNLKLKNKKFDLKYKKKIIKTTWELKNKNYPYGWLEKGYWSTHHNFDVAEIFLYLFDNLSEKEKVKVKRLFNKFLFWAIKDLFQKNGGFIGDKLHKKEKTSIYKTHLAILLLRGIGYFSESYREKIFNRTKQKINSYRTYKNKIPESEFDTSNLKEIIYINKKEIPDPLETRKRIYSFWKKHKEEDIVHASFTNEILKFDEFPIKDFKIRVLNELPKLKEGEILVKINRFGGKISI
jgi:hypothetical protein